MVEHYDRFLNEGLEIMAITKPIISINVKPIHTHPLCARFIAINIIIGDKMEML